MMSNPSAVSITLTPASGAPETVDVNAAEGYASAYSPINNGPWTVSFSSSTTNAPLTSVNQNFLTNGYYSVIGYNGGAAANYATMVLSDAYNFSNNLGIRVVNCLASAQNIDVYVTLSGQSYIHQSPTDASVAAGDNTQKYSLWTSPATYTITITPAGTQKTVLASYTTPSLIIGQGYTFVVTQSPIGETTVFPLGGQSP